jgi:hypothetical protein
MMGGNSRQEKNTFDQVFEVLHHVVKAPHVATSLALSLFIELT